MHKCINNMASLTIFPPNLTHHKPHVQAIELHVSTSTADEAKAEPQPLHVNPLPLASRHSCVCATGSPERRSGSSKSSSAMSAGMSADCSQDIPTRNTANDLLNACAK